MGSIIPWSSHLARILNCSESYPSDEAMGFRHRKILKIYVLFKDKGLRLSIIRQIAVMFLSWTHRTRTGYRMVQKAPCKHHTSRHVLARKELIHRVLGD